MAVSAQQIVDFLIANPNMSDAEIASVMNQFGVSPSDVAAATGADEATIQARYEEAAPVTSLLDAPVAAPIDEPPAAPVETVAAPPAPVAQSVDSLIKAGNLNPTQISEATGVPVGEIITKAASLAPVQGSTRLGDTYVSPNYSITQSGEEQIVGGIDSISTSKVSSEQGSKTELYSPTGELTSVGKYDKGPSFLGGLADMVNDPVVKAVLMATGLPAGIGEAVGLGTGATATAVGTGLLNAGTTAATGADLKDVVKAGLVGGGASLLGSTVSDLLTPTVDASTLTSEEFNDLINKGFAEDLKAAGVKNVSEFTTNVGGNAGTFYDAAGNPVVAPPVASPVSPTGSADNLVINAPRPVAPPTSPTIANVISTIGTQLPDAGTVKVEDKRIKDEKATPVVPTPPTVPEVTVTGTRPVITAPTTPIPPIVPTVPLVLPTIPTPPTTPTPPAPPPDKTPSIADVLKVIGGVAAIGGVANAVTPPKTTYPIVPIPTDWKPPTTQPTSPYQPLTPIDFGNQNLLKGTQWEKFLDPNYGKVPTSTPTAPASNMSYSNLMDILGNKQGAPMPAGNLSINDIISGIQNQYGQAPSSTMGQKPA